MHSQRRLTLRGLGEGELHFVAIIVRIQRRDSFQQRWIGDSPQSPKLLTDEIDFDPELFGVVQMQPFAAPAASEVLADRDDPMGTRFQDLQDLGFGVAGMEVDQSRADQVLDAGVGQEYRHSREGSHAESLGRDILDAEFDFVTQIM